MVIRSSIPISKNRMISMNYTNTLDVSFFKQKILLFLTLALLSKTDNLLFISPHFQVEK